MQNILLNIIYLRLMKKLLYISSIIGICILISSFNPPTQQTPPFIHLKSNWADSILSTLSEEEKIAQLFMVAAYSNKGSAHQQEMLNLIENYHIGGLIFFQGGPLRQASLTNLYQSSSKIPLMIGIDAEWGLGMRLDSTQNFPRQLMLGAIQDNTLIYQMGREVARQCKLLGIHVNFAPVVDINNNPNNPIINDRSFGENKYTVTAKGIAYMQGLQDGNILACAKHFPGHGDTDQDSHLTLPVVNQPYKRIDTLELYPFKQLINRGVGSIMAAHLFVPAIDNTANTATSLSSNAINSLLKEKMNFKGLVFTDALNMKGVSNFYAPGEVDVQALLAGNDVLLFAEDVPRAIKMIQAAIAENKISMNEIEKRVLKILKAKEWSGLNNYTPLNLNDIVNSLNTPYTDLLNQKLHESAMTLLGRNSDLIPFKRLDTIQFASIIITDQTNEPNTFQQTLNKYAPFKNYYIDKNMSDNKMNTLLNELQKHHVVIVSLHDMSRYASKNYGITEATKTFISKLNRKTNLVLSIFGSPYSLKYFDEIKNILVAYEDDALTQNVAAQVLFGGINANGKLPISASNTFKYNMGSQTASGRLKYTIPEECNINRASLHLGIDTIVQQAIVDYAMPGCQILIAKDGKVIFEKAYGYHTYEKKNPVRTNDLYDIASITKIAATTISLMKLYDEGKIKMNKKVSAYITGLKETDKKNIDLQDILLHEAGLKAWIPFYKSTLTEEGICDENYCYAPNDYYSLKVADDLYLQNEYMDTIWTKILESETGRKRQYVYSDLGFYFAKNIVEDITKQTIKEYTNQTFYVPLGLTSMCYNPIEKFPLSRIIPTELDTIFRKQLIHGYVHDQGAAMTGGIGGHAGLFSNMNDFAVLMQMLLNDGKYGYQSYFKPGTVKYFTSRQTARNRRGLGFDKPEMDTTKISPASYKCSAQAFGHTGFTGTCVWADPQYNLIYVFLSNRVHPNADNRKLIDTNVRTRIQDVIYSVILKEKGNV